jgi:tetratricopeptide (TPR) repeat protein
MQRAIAYHRDGRLDEAEAVYKMILEEHPEHADALHLLGALFYQKRNYREAVFY